MSLLYSSNFKYPDGELRKHQEFMDLSHCDSYQQQNQHNSGLVRYRSAPSSFLESLVNGAGDQGGGSDGTGRVGCEDYSYFRSSSPEMDTMFDRFLTSYNGTAESNNHDLQEFGERPAPAPAEPPEPALKQEMEGSQMVYQSLSVHNMGNDSSVTAGNSLAGTFSVVNSMDLEIPVQEAKSSTTSGSNLPRQNSSPATFFSSLGVDNGFSMMRDMGSSSRAGDRFNGEAGPSSTRLSNQINFSSSQRVLPRIAEIGDESISASNPGGNVGKRQYMPNFKNDSWSDNLNGLKRLKSEDEISFSGLNNVDSQHGNPGNRLTGLTHHLSLPKTAAEMATVEKFLQFQDSAPCKIRAKRGFATHPRSIAERVRRTRISERMRKLQELFPDMDKQTNTADMLDLAVEHIKNLQKQVKTLKDTKANCMCSSKQKQCPSPLS